MGRMLSVLDYLEYNSANKADNIAVIEGDESLTYRGMRNLARNLSGAFIDKLNRKKRIPVVIFMDKGIKHLVSMYAALYSGNFFVPTDIKTPQDRFESVLNTLGEYLVITSKEYEELLLKVGYTGECLLYDDLVTVEASAELDEIIDANIVSIIDTDLMYLIFTSGSTGVPKGVAIMHRSLVDYMQAFTTDIGLSENDVCGNQAPFYADMSYREVFSCLAVGAAVCIIPQKLFMLPKLLLQYLEDKKVTFIAWVPTALRLVSQFDGLAKLRPSHINRVLFSGEGMPVPVFRYWKSFYPEAVFLQSYGPTEITGSCTYHVVDRDYADDEVIPIGKPFRNTGIALIDEDNNIVTEADVPGEICIYGTCLAAGYYHNPEKTKEVFTDLPEELGYGQKMYRSGDLGKYNENHEIVFISRKDYQIKHMGKRIELGEIETAMAAIEEIKGCCCVHNKVKDALVLYYIGDITNKEIISKAGKKLPPYMMPAKFVQMEALPQLPNGKLDRKLLAEMSSAL